MPDTSSSWEDLPLVIGFLKGQNSTDFTGLTTDIPKTDQTLIAAKGMLRRLIMAKCSKHASKFADRESFFDAIAAKAATDSDPLYEDVQDMLALAYLYHYYGSHRLADTDRMQTGREEALRDLKDAILGLCPTLGIELEVDTQPLGNIRTRGAVSSLHSRTDY